MDWEKHLKTVVSTKRDLSQFKCFDKMLDLGSLIGLLISLCILAVYCVRNYILKLSKLIADEELSMKSVTKCCP